MVEPDARGMGHQRRSADGPGMHRTPAPYRRVSILLAVALLAGMSIPTPTVAASITGRLTTGPTAPANRVSLWSVDARVDEHPADRPIVIRGSMPVWRFEARLAALDVIAALQVAEAAARAEASARAATAKAAAAANAAAANAAEANAATPAYVGKNHLWIPSLGLSRSVETFACTRKTPPANRVYRWGCAGKNNVYLFGHAWGVMKPLHDGYVAGRVKIGMVAKFADATGVVRTYRVTAIRIVTPDQVAWAIASQPVASMTLQTCIGANSDRRLLVRLVADH